MTTKKKTPAKKKPGPKKIVIPEPTKKLIETVYGYGLTLQQVCSMVEIGEDVIRREMGSRLKTAKTKLLAKLAESCFHNALKGDTTMQIFLSKVHLGWSDKKLEENQDMIPSFRISFEK